MMTKIKIWLLIWLHKNLYGYNQISVKVLYSQAMHETGNLSSAVYKENKNLFGMRQPSKRKTFAQGSNLNHAVYKNHNDSIRDYFERQKYFKISDTNDSAYMVETLASNYAEDKNYLPKWQAHYNKVKMPISNLWLYVGLFFFGILDSINH